MKPQIIPALNAKTLEEIKTKISLLKNLTNHFHLDVSTKEATGYEIWHNYAELKILPRNLEIDLHLMIYLKPLDIFSWNDEIVKIFIIHPEFCFNLDAILKQIKKIKKQIFLAWSPEVEFVILEKYLKFINGILILGVKPGKSGQTFLEETYERIEKIKSLKETLKLKLMIDGGVNENNFEKILKYQPDYVVMASAIYDFSDPKEKYKEFLSKI